MKHRPRPPQQKSWTVAVTARLAVTATSTEDSQQVLNQQKVIDAIKKRLEIAPEQNEADIKEELLKAQNRMKEIKHNQELKADDAD